MANENVVLRRDGLDGPTVVEQAPDRTLIPGEVVADAHNGSPWIQYERAEDGTTVLSLGTEGHGLGRVRYRLTGWYDVGGNRWRAERIEVPA